jgi:hypothetical protein
MSINAGRDKKFWHLGLKRLLIAQEAKKKINHGLKRCIYAVGVEAVICVKSTNNIKLETSLFDSIFPKFGCWCSQHAKPEKNNNGVTKISSGSLMVYSLAITVANRHYQQFYFRNC